MLWEKYLLTNLLVSKGKPLKEHGRAREYSLKSAVCADTSLGRNERMKTRTEVDLVFLPSGGDEGVWEWE